MRGADFISATTVADPEAVGLDPESVLVEAALADATPDETISGPTPAMSAQPKRHLVNIVWTLLDGASRLILGLVSSVVLARIAGPAAFGAFSFAMATVALLQPLVSAGSDQIVIRELTNAEPGDSPRRAEILGTAALLRLIGAVIGIVSIGVIADLVGHGDRDTVLISVVISLSLLFMAIDPIDFNFRTHDRAGIGARARVLASILGSITRIVVIVAHQDVRWIALTYLIDGALPAIVLLRAFGVRHLAIFRWRWSVMTALVRESVPLLFSAVSVVIYSRIDQVMLTSIKGAEPNAVYSAAVRVSEVANFVPLAIMVPLAPALVRARGNDADYLRIKAAIMRLFALCGGVVALGTAVLAGPLIHVLFGAQYVDAVVMLEVLSLAPFFVFMGVIQAYANLTEGKTRLIMHTVLAGAVVNIVANLLLIPRYGGTGASIATVLALGTANTFGYLLLPKHRDIVGFQLVQTIAAVRHPVGAIRDFLAVIRHA